MPFRTLRRLALCLLVLAALAPAAGATLVNGGFETDALAGVVDGWTPLATSSGNETVEQASVAPHTGSLHVESSFTSNAGSTTAAGLNQGGLSATAGVDYLFRIYIRLPDGESLQPNAPVYTGTSIVTRILWRNAAGNSLGQSSLFLTDEVTDVYQPFDLLGTAPTGTASADVGFFLQGGGLGGIDQTAWFDDASFQAVPEPAGAALLGVGLLGLAVRRRTRS